MSELTIATQEQLAIEDVKRLANIVRSLRNDVFKLDLDYGVIPGTGTKPTLLLPGMEKLMRALHLRAEYVERSKLEDFDNGRIYYRYECRLIDYQTGYCVATAIGSANSMETKWRWREQKRKCPVCQQETINKSKEEGKGWYCWKKIGGCGATFAENEIRILSQQVGPVENPDIFDQMNTIDKIAQKRALSSAIKGAANVSEFFTVDLEDFQHYEVRSVVTMDDGRDVETTTGEIVAPAPDKLTDVEKFEAIPRTSAELTEQPLKLAEHPKNTRVWDLGKVKTYAIVEKKYVSSKGGTPHFDNLIKQLEASVRITDTSSTEEVCRVIDAHYAAKDKPELKDAG